MYRTKKKRRKNSLLTELSIVIVTFLWGGGGLCNWLFRSFIDTNFTFFGHTFTGNKVTFIIALVIVLQLLLFFTLLKDWRHDWSNAYIISISSFLFLGILELIEKKLYLILIVMTTLIIGYALSILLETHTESRGKTKKERKADWKYACLKVYLCIILCFGVIGLSCITVTFIQRKVSVRAADYVEKEVGEKRSLSDLAIGFSDYAKMDDQERLDLLQDYANLLTDKLGIDRVPVFAKEMLRESVAAYYAPGEEKIYINIETLQDPDYSIAIDSIAHESYHAYQHEWINLLEAIDGSIKDERLYEVERARVWAHEFEDYHNYNGNGYEDYMKYATQSVEESASEFAELTTESFKSYIEYFEKNGAGSESENRDEVNEKSLDLLSY